MTCPASILSFVHALSSAQVAVGVGGTLGTGFFLLCGLLTSTYAGPSSTLCWLLSAVPALLSGFCFAELAGQIPAAGSTYA